MSNPVNLKELIEDRMQEIVDEIVENPQDYQDENPKELIDHFFDEIFDSCGWWWVDFELSKLSIDNIDEMLENYQEMKEAYRKEIPEKPLSVDYLMTLYGYWYGKTLKDKYVNILKDAWKQNEEQV
jgi:hypothetical protein